MPHCVKKGKWLRIRILQRKAKNFRERTMVPPPPEPPSSSSSSSSSATTEDDILDIPLHMIGFEYEVVSGNKVSGHLKVTPQCCQVAS